MNPGLLGERQLWLPQDYGDPRNSGKNVFIVIANENCFKKAYRKSSNTSRPLIQVASIRGRTIGGPVQPLIVGKILNPSKLPYLDHFELFEVKNLALELIFIEIPLIQV